MRSECSGSATRPITVDVLVQPVLIDRIAQVHSGLHVTTPDEDERVLHAVRVVADSTYQKDVPVRSCALKYERS